MIPILIPISVASDSNSDSESSSDSNKPRPLIPILIPESYSDSGIFYNSAIIQMKYSGRHIITEITFSPESCRCLYFDLLL